MINPQEYTTVIDKLRLFFKSKGFIEVPTQCRLSILAACEDPGTIATINYADRVWPLPQTGQMWLEYELLTKPNVPGYYCITTSYRQEPNPKAGRHDLIFPLFEFETHGGMDKLIELETELLHSLGFEGTFPSGNYAEIADKFATREIGHAEEERICREFGPVFFLKNFPTYTSPFWNMKLGQDGNSKKVDVILQGMETIGSAERSCNPAEMLQLFNEISDGKYRDILYEKFGKDRVDAEMNEFLSHKFIERCGGGIGITRLIRAMKMSKFL